MKKTLILTALGLATLAATPAFAQKPTHRARASEPYASAVQPAGLVVSSGYAAGTDPDPSIRSEMQRDWSTYSSTN